MLPKLPLGTGVLWLFSSDRMSFGTASESTKSDRRLVVRLRSCVEVVVGERSVPKLPLGTGVLLPFLQVHLGTGESFFSVYRIKINDRFVDAEVSANKV